jgi:hypothetical protein
VAARADRGRSRSLGTVRAVAGFASRPQIGVQDLRLVLVAPGARRGLLDERPFVGLVAAKTFLVTGRRARSFLGMAGAASRRGRWAVGRSPMARCAIGVTAVVPHACAFHSVAIDAKRELGGRRREVVRPVALNAGDASLVRTPVGRCDRCMTTAARACLDGRIGAVGHVARNAGILTAVIDVNLRVAGLARGRSKHRRVRHVAARAKRVRYGRRRQHGGKERGFGPVAADAELGREIVRLVAGKARIVSRWFRPSRLFMARRTALARSLGRPVRLVTVEAILAAGMLSVRKRPLFVTIRAGPYRDRGCFVGVVARLALCRAMGRHSSNERLRLGVATDASRSGAPGSKHVAHETIGFLLAPLVRVPGFLVVTTQTDAGARIDKPGVDVVVAILAHHRSFTHVLLVTETRAVLGPRSGYPFRRQARRSTRNRTHEGHDRPHKHGEDDRR